MSSEESRCDAVIAQLFGKDAIVRFGRRGRRTTGTPGVPDRAYFVRGVLLWYEVKEGKDRLSDAQERFLRRVLNGGGLAACGNSNTLRALVTTPFARAECVVCVDAWCV